jgi:hypothetical protein
MVFRYTVTAGDHESGDLQVGYRASADAPLQIGLEGHVSDLAGNLLDGAHINYSAPLYNHSGYGNGIQIDAEAGPAPSAPVLAAASDTGVTGDKLTNLHQPGLTGTGAASGAIVKLFDGSGALLAQTTARADNSWTISETDWLSGKSLADGTHQLSVRQYDGFNNESPASAALTLKVDSVIAAATVTLHTDSDSGSSHSDLVTNLTLPTFTGTGEASAGVTVYDGSTIVGEGFVNAGGTYEVLAKYNLAEGEHTLTVAQTDLAGNTSNRSASTPVNFRIDFTGPAAPGKPVLDAASDTGSSPSDRITKDKTPTISGTAAEAGGTIQIYEGGTLYGTATVKADKTWSFTIGSQSGYPAALEDGVRSLSVKQVDAAGNLSEASPALSVTVDTVAPVLRLKDSGVDIVSHKGWISFEFSEKIVFGNGGEIDVIDTVSHGKHSQHFWNAMTNWAVVNGEFGTENTLQLSLGMLNQLLKLHVDLTTNTIEDLAGNIVIIGSSDLDFTVVPTLF